MKAAAERRSITGKPEADSVASVRRGRLGAIGRQVAALPWPALLLGGALFALLGWYAAADPVRGVTISSSPFSDEGFNILNARNFVALGRWSTDEWNLHLVNLPFSLLVAASFRILGVGIVAARLVSIAAVAITAVVLAAGLRRPLGQVAALFAGVAFATSGLVLFYGRLAYVEDLVVLGLAAGAVLLAVRERPTFRLGLGAGAAFAVAIGTKPIAAFSVAGIFAGLALAAAATDPERRHALLRWLAGSAAAIAAFGIAWLLVIWMPNRDAVAMDLRIWAPEKFSLAPADVLNSISTFNGGDNDGLPGFLFGPLLLLGPIGLALIVALHRRLSGPQVRLVAAAVGWALAGSFVVIVASYRPNRYFMPVVPAFAIVAAVGLALALAWLRERSPRLGPIAGAVLVAAAIGLAAGPGLNWYAGWTAHSTQTLPEIQDRFARLVPAGERVAGRESGLFLMKSQAIALETQLTPLGTAANAGDLYATGVRWYLQPSNLPAPPGVPAAAWAQRQIVACARWDRLNECLIKLR